MYLEFFMLQRLPFKLRADTDFHYLAGDRLLAKGELQRAIDASSGPVLLWGEAGVGKTILLESCLQQLSRYMRVVLIRHPDLSSDEFYQAAAAQLTGDDAAVGASAGAAVRFEEAAAKVAAAGEQVLVAIDNGDLVSQDLLEDILRLTRRRRPEQVRVGVVLASRPELRRTLSLPRFGAADKQPSLQIELARFSTDHTRHYIDYRLKVAGLQGSGIFDEDAYAEIQRYTGGVAQLINTLADAAMTAAFGRSHGKIAGADIRTIASQLRWVEFNARAKPAPSTAEEPQPMPAYITIEHDNRVVAEHVLLPGKVTIGRALRSDIRIESRFVSRDHCRILTTPSASVIEDLQSQNGLMIRGQRASVHRLQDGDVIQIGEHYITYRHGRPAQAHVAQDNTVAVVATSSNAETIVIGRSEAIDGDQRDD
jgi:type II secretory pathway predicted ATPase ExeA/pSer/pThr/pTyr-binding forkhead associated (FHA) protein